jgi:hypothetical protein
MAGMSKLREVELYPATIVLHAWRRGAVVARLWSSAISTTRDDPIVRLRCARPMHESCASG